MIQSEFEGCPPSKGEELPIPADPGLVAEGWVRRYLADPDRASEAIELYTSMGYEVKAQKLTPEDLGPQCGDCASTLCSTYVLIYTRKPAPAA